MPPFFYSLAYAKQEDHLVDPLLMLQFGPKFMEDSRYHKLPIYKTAMV